MSDVIAELPITYLDESCICNGINIVDLMIDVGAAKSRSDAKRQIRGGGVYIFNTRVNDVNSIVRWGFDEKK